MLRSVAAQPAGSPGTFSPLTTTGLFTQAAEDSVTAHAGGTKALATALSATVNLHRISVCATAGDSVLMPPALVGQAHYLRNGGAAAAQVFGQSNDTINSVATATGISLEAGNGIWLCCETAGAWNTTFLASAPPVIGGTTPAAITGTTITASTQFSGPLGSVTATAFNFGTANTGLYGVSGAPIVAASGNYITYWNTDGMVNSGTRTIGWAPSTTPATPDSTMRRAEVANSIVFSASTAVAPLTSRTCINKAVTAFTDGAAKATFTVTIPNAQHSGSLMVRFTGALGAGGAIGAGEANATISYDIDIVRTAGVNAVATISTAYGSAASAVAGAATVTVTAAVSAISGIVSATNTFTVDVTITKSGGSSAAHTCLCFGELMNSLATGITIA